MHFSHLLVAHLAPIGSAAARPRQGHRNRSAVPFQAAARPRRRRPQDRDSRRCRQLIFAPPWASTSLASRVTAGAARCHRPPALPLGRDARRPARPLCPMMLAVSDVYMLLTLVLASLYLTSQTIFSGVLLHFMMFVRGSQPLSLDRIGIHTSS